MLRARHAGGLVRPEQDEEGDEGEMTGRDERLVPSQLDANMMEFERFDGMDQGEC